MSISSEIWEVLESTSKNNFNFLKKQIYTQKKEISNCQKCQFNWTRIAISQVSYILQELSDTTNLGGPILYGLFGSLGHTRLTAIKSAFGLDIILVYIPLSK